MQPYLEIVFTQSSPIQIDILTALLSEAGYEGFEECEEGFKAFIPKKDFSESELKEILQSSDALQNLNFSLKEIEPENWNRAWEENFQPINIDNQLYIRASFHPENKNIPLEIIIDPKMSFGTGHHATTHMMSQMLMDMELKNKTVFDFGSGTGILSILVAKLGSSSVYALDHEEWAYHNCLENCLLNNVKNIEAVWGDESRFPQSNYDIILANINRNIILKNLPQLATLLPPGGILLISGFLIDDVGDILQTSLTHRLARIEMLERDGWICMKLQK